MLVSKTYQVVTPESRENGDFEEQGFEFENVEMDLEEVIHLIESEGFVEWSSSDPVIGNWISTIEPEHSRDYIENGVEVYYSLHFKEISEDEFNELLKVTR